MVNALGVLASLSYKNEQTVYENTQDNLYNFSPEKSVFAFEENRFNPELLEDTISFPVVFLA